MKVYTYSEARQRLAQLLDEARSGEVRIKRRDGSEFQLRALKPHGRSPLDVPFLDSGLSREEVLSALRESRERGTNRGSA